MLIDSHIHYDASGDASKILEALEVTGIDKCCLQAQIYKKKINQNFDVFYAKLKCPNKVYINIALDSYLYYHQERMDEMPNYIKRMMECGADGIKMIEGKPTERKLFPIPDFDSPVYEATFKYIEDNKIHVTWHVNDPEEFWDEEKVPDWAKRSGWFYSDGTFVNNIDQYTQIERLLARHPKLHITFAHFYFKSADLDYLAKMFDKYPYVGVDITPGIELFTNMSENIEKAKCFFNKYYERIMYGTDISVDSGEINGLNTVDAITRKNLCHDFLAKDKVYLKGDEKGLLGKDDLIINGLKLDREKVEFIEAKNFLREYGEIKKLNINKILEEALIHRERLIEELKDTSYLDKLIEEFKKA